MGNVDVQFGISQIGVVGESLLDERSENGIGENFLPAEISEGGAVHLLFEGLLIVRHHGSVVGGLVLFINVAAAEPCHGNGKG